MDIELLKTFLEVERTRHFGNAADNLFITQSTVSARIRQLEDILGVTLFVRNRNNIQLTVSGARLQKHAQTILNTWVRANQELSLDEENQRVLNVGGVFSLWDILLQDWIHALYANISNIAVQAETGEADSLLRKLSSGLLDVCFLHEPPRMMNVQFKQVARIKLIMVSSKPDLDTARAIAENYVLVNWGTTFAVTHDRFFPELPPPIGRMAMGHLALSFLLQRGGTAYLAEPMCLKALADGKLFRVKAAPVLEHSAYAVYALHNGRLEFLEKALEYIG